MPAFTHDTEISERIIELAFDDSFDMVNLYPSLPRQSLHAVHHIGSNGSQDVFQRSDGVIRGIELHWRANAKLLRACKHGSAVFTRCAHAERPCVALHIPLSFSLSLWEMTGVKVAACRADKEGAARHPAPTQWRRRVPTGPGKSPSPPLKPSLEG